MTDGMASGYTTFKAMMVATDRFGISQSSNIKRSRSPMQRTNNELTTQAVCLMGPQFRATMEST